MEFNPFFFFWPVFSGLLLFNCWFVVFDFCSLYDNMWDDGNSLGPKEIHSYLTRVMYNRRNKFDPLMNTLLLGGVKKGKKFLGMVRLWMYFFLGCSANSCFASPVLNLQTGEVKKLFLCAFYRYGYFCLLFFTRSL